MKRIILPVLTASLALNAVLSLALWTAQKDQDQGGAEAQTVASIQMIREDHEEEEMLFPIRGQYNMTSAFGVRKSPFNGENSIHYGTDYAAPKGAEIQAVKDGVVVTHWPAPDGYYKGHAVYGGFIEILHDDGISRYAHMSRTFVHEGHSVEAGQVIGILGNTGMVVGKNGHLHMEYVIDVGRLYD